jgi:nucleoid-associated protein YgaU
MSDQASAEQGNPPRLLWGRLALAVAALVLAFVLGQCTASGDVSQAALENEQDKVAVLQSENASLKAELQARNASASPEPRPSATASPAGGPGTYEVQSGDSLNAIASSECGDAALDEDIAELNDVEPENLAVGTTLELPSECAG